MKQVMFSLMLLLSMGAKAQCDSSWFNQPFTYVRATTPVSIGDRRPLCGWYVLVHIKNALPGWTCGSLHHGVWVINGSPRRDLVVDYWMDFPKIPEHTP